MSTISIETASDILTCKNAQSEGSAERAVEALIFHIYKSFAAMKMYEGNHPALGVSLQRLLQSFDEFLETHGELKIHLTESEMMFQGLPVYHEEKRRSGLIFMLYNDGIREIRFESGLCHEEIFEFLNALKTNSRLPPEDRDIVSLFWSKGFSHIHYYAVEEIPDEEIESVDKAIASLESPKFDSEPTGNFTIEEGSESWNRDLKSEKNTAEIPSTSEVISQLKAVDRETLEQLPHSFDQDRAFDPESEIVDIIFDVLYLEDQENQDLVALKLLEDYSGELITRGDFARVNLIVQKLKTCHESSNPSKSLLRQHAEELLKNFSSETYLNFLRRGLKESPPDQEEALRIYITRLDTTAIGSICSLLSEIEDSHARRSLCQGLAVLTVGQTSQMAIPLKTASGTVAKDIVHVLELIGDDSAIALLIACANHSRAEVREEAVRALRGIETPNAHNALPCFLNDPDPVIRTTAAEGLANSETFNHINHILGIIRDKAFNKRSYREKKALLMLLANNGSMESVDTLERMLRKKSLFSRKKNDETRVCAALALTKVSTEHVQRLVERFSRDASPQVRRACQQALLSIQGRRSA